MIGVSLFSAEIKAVTNLIVQLRAAKFRPVSMDYNEYTTMLYAYTNTLFHFQINHTHARTHARTQKTHTHTHSKGQFNVILHSCYVVQAYVFTFCIHLCMKTYTYISSYYCTLHKKLSSSFISTNCVPISKMRALGVNLSSSRHSNNIRVTCLYIVEQMNIIRVTLRTIP